MTKHVPSLEAIRSKKEAFLASAAKYEALASQARAEAADYEAAERVWLLLAPEDTLDDEAKESAYAGKLSTTNFRKPSSVPSVPDMIVEFLRDSSSNWQDSL